MHHPTAHPSHRRATLGLVVGCVALLVLPLPCLAAEPVVKLWPGVAPGSEGWNQKEATYENTPVGTVIMNVVTPTLTVYLPDKARATGTGVIVAPGGAFVALAISREGTDVARWLQQRGIAAFLLKYRTIEKKQEGIPQLDQDKAASYGITDAQRALEIVREHAAEWGVSPDRVGILGFSAGGMVASGTLLKSDAAHRPSFAALIYGAPFGDKPAIPTDLPPVFLAWAQDDPIALEPIIDFAQALLVTSAKPGAKPELHAYRNGGHGFGLQKQGKSSDHWIDDFENWLAALGLTRPVPPGARSKKP